MTRAYIVTESHADVEILKRILPEELSEVAEFVPGSGSYSAQSSARTLLAVKKLPVALVVDSDTRVDAAIREREDFLHYLLDQASGGVQFKVLVAVPETEAVFFEDQALIEQITGQRFSADDWESAKRHPKEFLTQHLHRETLVDTALSAMSKETIQKLRKHPLISDLCGFLSSLTTAVS